MRCHRSGKVSGGQSGSAKLEFTRWVFGQVAVSKRATRVCSWAFSGRSGGAISSSMAVRSESIASTDQPRRSTMKTAENIAKGQFSVVEVMTGWMNSEGHRANILDPDFTEVGFGFSYGLNNNGFEVIWAQNFGREFL